MSIGTLWITIPMLKNYYNNDNADSQVVSVGAFSGSAGHPELVRVNSGSGRAGEILPGPGGQVRFFRRVNKMARKPGCGSPGTR